MSIAENNKLLVDLLRYTRETHGQDAADELLRSYGGWRAQKLGEPDEPESKPTRGRRIVVR